MPTRGKKPALFVAALALAVLALAFWLSWPHLHFWWLFEPLGPNAQGYTEYRHRKTGIVFVSLPGGKFWMGAQKTDPNGQNYDPEAWEGNSFVHEVALSPFVIGKFEVTQEQWRRVLGTNPSNSESGDLPVEMVTWNDCQEFCRRTELKLPTEAQWEYACRAGTTGPYAGTGRLEDMGWYDGNSGDRTHPVGQKQPNGFGLHDMHGNAEEWCEDVYNESFHSMPEAGGLDPVCASGYSFRVVRGGAFGDIHDYLRCAYRFANDPDCGGFTCGFRVVASPAP